MCDAVPVGRESYIISAHDCYISAGIHNCWGGTIADIKTRWRFIPLPELGPNYYAIQSHDHRYLARRWSGVVELSDTPSRNETEWLVLKTDFVGSQDRPTFSIMVHGRYLTCMAGFGWILANTKDCRGWERWVITVDRQDKQLTGPSGRIGALYTGGAAAVVLATAAAAAVVAVVVGPMAGVAAGVSVAGGGTTLTVNSANAAKDRAGSDDLVGDFLAIGDEPRDRALPNATTSVKKHKRDDHPEETIPRVPAIPLPLPHHPRQDFFENLAMEVVAQQVPKIMDHVVQWALPLIFAKPRVPSATLPPPPLPPRTLPQPHQHPQQQPLQAQPIEPTLAFGNLIKLIPAPIRNLDPSIQMLVFDTLKTGFFVSALLCSLYIVSMTIVDWMLRLLPSKWTVMVAFIYTVLFYVNARE